MNQTMTIDVNLLSNDSDLSSHPTISFLVNDTGIVTLKMPKVVHHMTGTDSSPIAPRVFEEICSVIARRDGQPRSWVLVKQGTAEGVTVECLTRTTGLVFAFEWTLQDGSRWPDRSISKMFSWTRLAPLLRLQSEIADLKSLSGDAPFFGLN